MIGENMAKVGHLAKYAFKRKEEEIPLIDMRKASSYNLDELNKLRRRLAKRANQRLRDIERAGYTDAYVYASTMSGYLLPSERTRFFEGTRNLELRSLKTELDELRWFLNAKTSTVGGIRKFERATSQKFAELGSFQKNPDLFWKYMSSASVKHLKKLGYSSEELIEFYDFATESRVGYDDVMSAVRDFEQKKIDSWDELYSRVGLSYITKEKAKSSRGG